MNDQNMIEKYVKRLKESKDGKVLAENMFYITILEFVRYALPLLTIPFLARVLGVDGVGKVAFANAIIVWINTIVNWGFDSSAVRDLAQNKNDEKYVSDLFFDVFWSRSLLMIISFIILVMLIITIPQFNVNADVILVAFVSVPANIVSATWFFRGIEKMKYITLLSVIAQILFTVLVFLFVRTKDDYIMQPLFTSIGSIVCAIIAVVIRGKKYRLTFVGPRWGRVKKAIFSSTDIFINQLLPNFYNNFSAILLGFYGGSVANGIYDAGKKMCNIVNTVQGAAISTFFPYFSRKTHRHSQFAKINIGVSLVACLAMVVFAPILIRLFYGDKFVDAIPVARIVAFALPGIILNYVYGTNYLIVIHRERLLRNITAVVSLLGGAIAFVLIPKLGCVGAALTYTISSVLIGVIPMFASLIIKRNE